MLTDAWVCQWIILLTRMLSLLIDIVSVSLAGHLLLHGPFSHDVWSFVFSTFGLHWMMPEKVIDVYTLVGKG